MRLFVEGIGLLGPGLNGWASAQAILSGQQDYVSAPLAVPPCALLPANERRRAPQIVKLALAAGAEAFAAAARAPQGTPSVFASSGGDGETIHEILQVLASPEREISPTRFHNSVHNTAAGYWSISTGSRAASTSLCCYDSSFAAGLLEAAAQLQYDASTVALFAYDVPYPEPLHAVRPIGAAFAVTLVLAATASTATRAALDLQLSSGAATATSSPPALEDLRTGTPAARSLPLLAALAGSREADITLGYLEDMALNLRVTPHAAP